MAERYVEHDLMRVDDSIDWEHLCKRCSKTRFRQDMTGWPSYCLWYGTDGNRLMVSQYDEPPCCERA